jgi:hypothetical protein
MKKNTKSTKNTQNKEQIAFAVTRAVVFNKEESLYGEYSTDIELNHDGTDSWLCITQEWTGRGRSGDKVVRSIEINFDEWPLLQAAVELIIKTQPPKFN